MCVQQKIDSCYTNVVLILIELSFNLVSDPVQVIMLSCDLAQFFSSSNLRMSRQVITPFLGDFCVIKRREISEELRLTTRRAVNLDLPNVIKLILQLDHAHQFWAAMCDSLSLCLVTCTDGLLAGQFVYSELNHMHLTQTFNTYSSLQPRKVVSRLTYTIL